MEVHLLQLAFPVQLVVIVDWDSRHALHVKQELSIHFFKDQLSHRVLPARQEATIAIQANHIARLVQLASTAIRRGCTVLLEVVLRDRFLLEARPCLRVIFVLLACTAMRPGFPSRLVRAAPGRIPSAERPRLSARPALLECTATQAGLLRRPAHALRARSLQLELLDRSVRLVQLASTAIRRG